MPTSVGVQQELSVRGCDGGLIKGPSHEQGPGIRAVRQVTDLHQARHPYVHSPQRGLGTTPALLKLASALCLRLGSAAGVDTDPDLAFSHGKLWASPFPSRGLSLSLFTKGEFG